MADTTAPTDVPQHPPHGLAVALSRLGLDTLTVTNAVADVADTAGENVTTAVRAEGKELRADMNARFAAVQADMNARFAASDACVEGLRADMNARFAAVQADMNVRFAETNARIDTTNAHLKTTNARIESLQREMSTLRWMIGVGFTLLGLLLALSTYLQSLQGP